LRPETAAIFSAVRLPVPRAAGAVAAGENEGAARARKAEEDGAFPRPLVERVFRTALGRLPPPNRPTMAAIDEAAASVPRFLEQFAVEHVKLCVVDDDPDQTVTRRAVEAYMLRSGLLRRESLADAARRLLDREDSDVAIDIPRSVARAPRPGA